MSTRDHSDNLAQRMRIQRAKEIIQQKKEVLSVRPNRHDGYINVLNRYGTSKDSGEHYRFMQEPVIPDSDLAAHYEGNGLFAKIIDTPAEEAIKHGFELGINDAEIESFVERALDALEFEDKVDEAIKWARLFGGSIIVMLIDDGGSLEEPVNWRKIRSIDELRVYERAVVQPDYNSIYQYDPASPLRNNASKFGMPEFYYVTSIYGSFVVHESRCLVFRNGKLPERTTSPVYRFWGVPEYVRIRQSMKETITAHGNGPKLLDRSVQPVYKMKDLATTLAQENGEDIVVKRLELIDLARGILNSIAIDKDGEEYDFKSFQFTGVKDVIDSTCNMLSAITNIPQTILFGRSPAGQNSTGESDFETYYNFIERIQKKMLKSNIRTLLDILFKAGAVNGDIDEIPDYKLEFSPLWSLSETEQATVDSTKAQTQLVKAQTAQAYVDMQVLDPSEIRTALAKSDEFEIENIIDEEDEDWGIEAEDTPSTSIFEQGVPLPSPDDEPLIEAPRAQPDADDVPQPTAAATLVFRNGRLLTGKRKDNGLICGPGGHIEEGETPEEAARREAVEEFGITLGELTHLGRLEGMPKEYGLPEIFLCTDFEGEPSCDLEEMSLPIMQMLSDVDRLELFPPFAKSIDLLLSEVGDGK